MPVCFAIVAGIALWCLGCSQDAPIERAARAPAGAEPTTAQGSDGPGVAGAGAGFDNMALDRPAGPPDDRPTQPAAPSSGDCGAVVQMAENTLQPVDIIFGVDTTGSMGEEIGFTEANMNAFSQQVADAGIDARVILISGPKDGMPAVPVHLDGVCIAPPLGSGSCPADSNPPAYIHVPQPLTDWDMLQSYIDLYPMYRQYLRDGSFRTFVSITDGDIMGNPLLQLPINSADAFAAAVEELEPGSSAWASWRYSAIHAFSPCGVGNAVGAVHADLVERTQGVSGDLCLQDFAPVFEDLAQQVTTVVTLACDWEIPPPPSGESFDPGRTNVEVTLDGTSEALSKVPSSADCGARDGWRYDDEGDPQRVVACPSTCARIQSAAEARVDLLFGCETVILPPE